MAIVYTWKVTGVKTTELGNKRTAITHIHWQKIGTDEDGNVGTFDGVTPLDEVNVDSFTPYKKVTEGNMLTWVKDKIGLDKSVTDHINNSIESQINSKKVKVVNTKLPWEK